MKELKETAASWARSFLAAALGMYAIGVTDPKKLAMGGVAALVPVMLRWLNPKDAAFGVKGK
jgi:hypothetical protein